MDLHPRSFFEVSVLNVFILTLLLSGLGLGTANAKPYSINAHAQRMSQDVQTLNTIRHTVYSGSATPKQLSQLRHQVRDILSHTKSNITVLQSRIDTQKTFLDTLGPAPLASEPPEDADLAAQRAKYKRSLGVYTNQNKKARAIVATGQELLNTIFDVSTQLRIQKLLRRHKSLLNADIGAQLKTDITQLGTQIQLYTRTLRQNISNMQHAAFSTSEYGLLLSWLVSVFLLLGPLQRYIHKLWPEVRRRQKCISNKQRIQAFLNALCSRLIFPSTILYISIDGAATLSWIAPHVEEACKALTLVFAAHQFLSTATTRLIAGKQKAWRVFDYSDKTAKALQCNLHALIHTGSLFWAYLYANELLALPASVHALLLFIGHVCIAYRVLALYPVVYWLLPSQEARETHLPPARFFVRLILTITLLANPVLHILGYQILATYVFCKISLTLLLVTVLVLAFFLFRRYLAMAFVRPNIRKLVVPSLVALAKARRHRFFMLYWARFLLGLLLTMVGAVMLLLTWGMALDKIVDWGEFILFGTPLSNHNLSLLMVLIAIALFLLVYSTTRFVQRVLSQYVFPHTSLDTGAINALHTTIGYIGMTIAAIIAITSLGFDFSSIMLIAGGLSVGVGLGLQPIVTNFVSGLIMLIERPVKVGDLVTVNNEQGFVSRISVRATTVCTMHKSELLIPNSTLITSTVKNWSHGDNIQRVDIGVGVAYGSDIDQVEKLLYKIGKSFKEVLKNPAPMVRFVDFGDNALMFQLRVFIKGLSPIGSKIRFAIDKQFNEHGIQIPFPQREVRILDNGPKAKKKAKPVKKTNT